MGLHPLPWITPHFHRRMAQIRHKNISPARRYSFPVNNTIIKAHTAQIAIDTPKIFQLLCPALGSFFLNRKKMYAPKEAVIIVNVMG